MAVNTAAIRDLLLPGLYAITGKYEMIPKQWPSVFERANSDKAFERTAEMRYLPLATLKGEGAATLIDGNAGERYVWNQEHNEIGLGFVVTQKAMEDNQYKAEFPLNNLGLMNSFAQTKEIYGASVFNNAFSPQTGIGGDGKALCATDHPIDGGTYANRPAVDVDLNENTLLSMMISIQTGYKDQAGLRIMSRARKLVVPPTLAPVAARITKAELRPGTGDNDPNIISAVAGGLSEGFVVLDFLTSNFAWFLTTNIKGLLYMKRIGYSTSMHTDFLTDNLIVKGRERYSFGFNNPRSLAGTAPTS